jgi:hypothetical protein
MQGPPGRNGEKLHRQAAKALAHINQIAMEQAKARSPQN